MDYAFAPGTIRGRRLRNTPQDRRVRRMFRRRPITTLITRRRRRSTVRQFIQHVSTHHSIPRPIDDLLVGAHANDQGSMFIPMFPGQRGPTKFETLERTINDAARSIEIPDATIGHAPGDPITHFFHIKGCSIGQARPFLVKLKEALGDNVNVTAPKHFHILYYNSRLGVFEGMGYEYTIIRRDPFQNRADVVAAFQANPNFVPYDGSAVPAAEWDDWLPRRIRRNHLRTRKKLKRRIRVNLGLPLGRRNTIPYDIEFRSYPNRFRYTVEYDNRAQVPRTRADQEQDLEDTLNDDPTFDAGHDFPEYERWGYSDIDDFIQGYTWRFNRNGKYLVCIGRRYEYTLVPPIMDLNTGNFIYNFYPNQGSPHPARLNGLVVNNADFFETV